jgi:hypothetical protein
MRFQVHGHRVRVEIGFVVLGIQPHQDVADHDRAKDVSHRDKQSLVQDVTSTSADCTFLCATASIDHRGDGK